jgi:hypothetical protein
MLKVFPPLLESYSPTNWRDYGPALIERIQTKLDQGDFIEKRERSIGEPKDKNGIGHAFWLCIGGRRARLQPVATFFKCDESTISSLVHGHTRLARRTLEAMLEEWPPLLEAYSPEDWQRHGPPLIERIRTELARDDLFEKHGRPIKKPENPYTFGSVIYLILGGDRADRGLAAERLGVTGSELSNIIQDKLEISQEWINDREWKATLQKYYPKTWEQNRAVFEIYFNNLRANGLPRKKWGIRQAWQFQAAEVVRGILNEKLETADSVLPRVHEPRLKNREAWQTALDGDRRSDKTIFLLALEELFSVFGIDHTYKPQKTYRVAVGLMMDGQR